MDEDDFKFIKRKPLKLASDGRSKGRNKCSATTSVEVEPENVIAPAPTKAELVFKSKQEKTAQGRIMKRASKTHKQRVEEFNKHLDSISEHYDIPKVSWTK